MKYIKVECEPKKISSHDGAYVNLDKDGQVWVSEGDTAKFSSPGFLKNGYFNAYHLLGVEKKYEKYYPVDYKILKYADRLGIEHLRFALYKVVDTDRGGIQKVKFGYVDSSEFNHLRKRRKKTERYGNGRRLVLLKKSDMSIERE